MILHANSQFRTQPSFTLSPLRKRNVAWRASLCVCWTGGSGLHECNTKTVLSIKVSIKFIYFYFKDYTSKYLKIFLKKPDFEFWHYSHNSPCLRALYTSCYKKCSHRRCSWNGLLTGAAFCPLCGSGCLYGRLCTSGFLYWASGRWMKGFVFCRVFWKKRSAVEDRHSMNKCKTSNGSRYEVEDLFKSEISFALEKLGVRKSQWIPRWDEYRLLLWAAVVQHSNHTRWYYYQ